MLSIFVVSTPHYVVALTLISWNPRSNQLAFGVSRNFILPSSLLLFRNTCLRSMQEGLQQKQTPNRRRQGGRSRNTPKQTTYASENDVPRYKSGHDGNPTTPVSEAVETLRASSTSQKQRSKKKKNNNNKQPNANDGAVSPGRNNPDRPSPSAPIFAGSTFHASPAPSALPIPSFLNRSEPDTPGMKAASSPEQELSCTTSDSDETSSPSPITRAPSRPWNSSSVLTEPRERRPGHAELVLFTLLRSIWVRPHHLTNLQKDFIHTPWERHLTRRAARIIKSVLPSWAFPQMS